MARRNSTYLLILGDREGVAWVLREGRMAFTVSRAEMAYTLQPGDRLFLYTSRGCFHNPTRDRGRVVGEARVRSPVVELRKAVHVAGREFALACDLEIRSLAPLGKGLELVPLVPRLRAFPRPQSWSVMMRRPLLALPAPDAKLIDSLLRKVAGAPEGGRQTYLDAAVVTIS